MAQFLNLKNYRPLVLPSAALLAGLAILEFESILHQSEFPDRIWPTFALPTFRVGFPLILLTLALIRRKG